MKLCYTVCSLNRLGQVLVLAESIRVHKPDYRFVACFADEIGGRVEDKVLSQVEWLTFSQLGLGEKTKELSDRYNIFELSCALKAYFGKYLVEKYSPEVLLYFDTDIKVYHRFDPIEEALQRSSIVLTPHFVSPLPNDGKFPLERDPLNGGLYNGGFFALKNDATTKGFLNWWQERLETQGHNRVCEGMMVDQLWLNFVPLFFPNVSVLMHPGCNTAYWNLHERRLERKEGFEVNGEPLVFFHFSGYRIQAPRRLSEHQNRIREEEHPELLNLLDDYHQSLLRHRFETYLTIPPVYGNQRFKKKIPFAKKVLIDGLAKMGYALEKIRKV